MEGFEGLFSENVFEGKLDFLNDAKKASKNDGLYKPDMSLVKDKSRGYRATLRFLPNLFKKDGKTQMGQASIECMSHYVRLQDHQELSGKYDSPRNFGKECTLTKTYYALDGSNNAIMKEKAKSINFSRNYYSYVLILEDEQQPELVGKIMIYRFGKTILDKIKAEEIGEIGDACNVYSWSAGKDFKLIITETGGEQRYPDYKKSAFVPTTSSIQVYNEERKAFKHIPLDENGNIHPEYQGKLVEFLFKREFELSDFEPKELTEEQIAKVNQIAALLTNKAMPGSNPSSNDLDFTSDDDFEDSTESFSFDDDEEDDFF